MENFLTWFLLLPIFGKTSSRGFFRSWFLIGLGPRWRPTVVGKCLPGGDLSLALNLGLLGGWKAKKSAILRFVLILQSQIFQHGGAENFEVFKFQSQKCFWSKFKSRHGCYNPQRIICNHLKLWISWDAQEIKRFSISFGGDIFFATLPVHFGEPLW